MNTKIGLLFLVWILQIQGFLETLTSYDGFTSVGGSGGSAWDYFEYNVGIKEIQAWIAYGGAINSMKFELFDGRTMFVGREQYGAAYTSNIVFSLGEKVLGSINVCEDSYWPFVSCIEFTTSYGQSFSSCDYNIANCRTLYAPSSSAFTLSGVFGRSGTSIDQIGFYARIGEDDASYTSSAPTEYTSTTESVPESSGSSGSGSGFTPEKLIGGAVGAIGGVAIIGASIGFMIHFRKRPAPVVRSKPAVVVVEKPLAPPETVETGEKEFEPTATVDDAIPPPAYDYNERSSL